MKTLDFLTLVKEYREYLKQNRPDMYPFVTSDAQLADICRYQFVMLHREIANGTLRPVRIKYLGLFKVPRSRAIGLLNKFRRLHGEGKLSEAALLGYTEVANRIINEPETDEIETCEESPDDEIQSDGDN